MPGQVGAVDPLDFSEPVNLDQQRAAHSDIPSNEVCILVLFQLRKKESNQKLPKIFPIASAIGYF